MQQIETAVRKTHFESLAAPLFHPVECRLPRDDFHAAARQFGGPERRRDVVGVGDRGADLADDDPRRRIGQFHRPAGRNPCRQTRGHGGGHRVAGAGNVEHVARFRGEMPRRLSLYDQAHAVRAPGRENALHAGTIDKTVGRGDDVFIAVRRLSGSLGELLQVRRDQVRSRVRREVAALGVDHHRNACLDGEGDNLLGEAAAEHPLAVIGKYHGAAVRQRRQHLFQNAFPKPAVQRLQGFLIGAEHLLGAGDVARLDGGRPVVAVDQIGLGAGQLAQQRGDPRAGGIAADDRDEGGRDPQAREVAGDISGPAEHFHLTLHPQHRNGRFG